MSKIGLVLEGGGMKCAYTAGILDAMNDKASLLIIVSVFQPVRPMGFLCSRTAGAEISVFTQSILMRRATLVFLLF